MRDSKGRRYVGITMRLRVRIREHNAGKTRGDRGRGPFKLVHKEACQDHGAARVRERYLKSGAGRRWLKRRLSGNDRPPESGLIPPGGV